MGATVAESAAADAPLVTERSGSSIASSAAGSRSPGRRPRSCSPARSPTTSRRCRPGPGCYAALLTNKGKMLADLRVLDTGSELWLDTERGACRRCSTTCAAARSGWQAELHKRTLQQALLSLVGPRARAVGGEVGPELANAPRSSAAPTCCSSRPTWARRRLRRRGRRARPRRPRRARVPEAAPRSCASSPGARATASTSTTRRSPRRRPQRARRELHQGLLRRPGDGRAAALHGQAQPPSARPALLGAGASGTPLVLGEREVGRVARAWCRRASGRSGWRWCGARRASGTSSRRARRSRSFRAAVLIAPRGGASCAYSSPRGSGPVAARPLAVVLARGELPEGCWLRVAPGRTIPAR
jgi:hypothetical protein